MSTAATARSALPSGFEELYSDHYDFVWRCALRLGATPEDVEDVVQETFIVALRRYPQTRFEAGGARPSTWLFAILHNVLRNHARGERRRRARLEALAGSESIELPRSRAESSLGLRLLDEFLRELEPDRRAVFVLAELEGMRGPEIARALGLNHNTVRSRLRAARQAFEARFDHEREPLVEAAANEAAPSEARARGLALLGLPLARSASAGSWLGWLTGARWLLALGFGSLVAIGLGLMLGSEVEPPATTEVEPPASASEARPPTMTAVETSPRATVELDPAIVIELGSPPGKTRRSRPAQLDASAALDRLDRARAALLAGDPQTCLTLIDDQHGWPTDLDARRVALEIGALCTLDQPERARAKAQAWSAAHPNARTAVQLRAVCWTDD
ncbi:MAG TPA: sigma-70 family RNA polymerase sigma factor [Enhygromyxa sp.]|nr:sigma-70 family RNA polymerase sigma factor [Enhygromyxa sp.]